MRQERWKPVVGYETEYEVSNLGRVRRTGRPRKGYPAHYILKQHHGATGGYPFVRLCRSGRQGKSERVHRLVALAFLGQPPHGYEVHHRNAIRTDARLHNLMYVSKSENCKIAFAMGHLTRFSGENNSHAKLSWRIVRSIRLLSPSLAPKRSKKRCNQIRCLARQYHVSDVTIYRILSKTTWNGH